MKVKQKEEIAVSLFPQAVDILKHVNPMKAQTNQTISKRLDRSQMHGRSTQNQTKNRKLFPCANRIINKTLFYTCLLFLSESNCKPLMSPPFL